MFGNLDVNCYAESSPLVSCCSPSPLADSTSATAAEAGIHSRRLQTPQLRRRSWAGRLAGKRRRGRVCRWRMAAPGGAGRGVVSTPRGSPPPARLLPLARQEGRPASSGTAVGEGEGDAVHTESRRDRRGVAEGHLPRLHEITRDYPRLPEVVRDGLAQGLCW